MATKAEKEELLQTLKFTPVRARILIQGYGGECYIGSVPRETYEFFKSKKIDLDQYANDWDGELFDDVPEEHRFFEPGSAYECDDHFHGSGATMDDSSVITVEDENGNVLWESTLDLGTLDEKEVEIDCIDEFESCDLSPGTVIFWGGQGEKGCFFDGEVLLTSPFDPSKLKIYYGNGDDWYLSGGVEYNGEEIDGTSGYSTTGKWSENKFWIAGDEEVYEAEERNEDEEDEDESVDCDTIEILDGEEMQAQEAIDSAERSEWLSKDLKPNVKGIYEVMKDAEWPNSGMIRAEWTGRSWKDEAGNKVAIRSWRGLAYDPALEQ